MAENNEGRDIAVRLVGLDEVPILLANHFVIQSSGDGFTLTVSQAPPPIFVGASEEEREAQLEALESVPARVIGRFLIPEGRLRQLIDLLHLNLERYERVVGRTDDGNAE